MTRRDVARRGEFFSGVRAELPILLGVAPFGMIYGALAVGTGLPAAMAQAMSAIVFAGSAQFIAAQLIGSGAPALVLLMTTFIVNIRHMLYSASIAPYFRPLRPAWKWFLAYLLTDEAFAVAIIHYQQTEGQAKHEDIEDAENQRATPPSSPLHRSESLDLRDRRHWYFLGAGLALWTTGRLARRSASSSAHACRRAGRWISRYR